MEFPEGERLLGCLSNFTHNLEVFSWQKYNVTRPIPTGGTKDRFFSAPFSMEEERGKSFKLLASYLGT